MKHRILREFFLLTRAEQRGLLVTAILLFISILARFLLDVWPARVDPVQGDFLDEAQRILLQIEERAHNTVPEMSLPAGDAAHRMSVPPLKKDQFYGASGSKEKPMQLQTFDPNDISEQALLNMRLPAFAVANLVKYRQAGGYFWCAEDLLKIYGIDTLLWLDIAPYLVFNTEVKSSVGIDSIEINLADSASLLPLPGIGPVLASRIIKYRNLLGGFVSLEQLNEVYGMELYDLARLVPLVSLNTELVCGLDINSASYSTLLRHPYLDQGEVEAIMQYRTFRGTEISPEELLENHLLDSAKWEKVSNYIK